MVNSYLISTVAAAAGSEGGVKEAQSGGHHAAQPTLEASPALEAVHARWGKAGGGGWGGGSGGRSGGGGGGERAQGGAWGCAFGGGGVELREPQSAQSVPRRQRL
eukprot:4611686-Pleurochrysis_carterae.AAC.3